MINCVSIEKYIKCFDFGLRNSSLIIKFFFLVRKNNKYNLTNIEILLKIVYVNSKMNNVSTNIKPFYYYSLFQQEK